jgi:hypothetical protein
VVRAGIGRVQSRCGIGEHDRVAAAGVHLETDTVAGTNIDDSENTIIVSSGLHQSTNLLNDHSRLLTLGQNG